MDFYARRSFLESLGITHLHAEVKRGHTDGSKQFFEHNGYETPNPSKVVLSYVGEDDWTFSTYVVDESGVALEMFGFAWGYGGKGPRGLAWLFEWLGWAVDPRGLPPAHVVGTWIVSPDGSVIESGESPGPPPSSSEVTPVETDSVRLRSRDRTVVECRL